MDSETATSSELSSPATINVECDACIGMKRKAEQSCLECVESYCESHLDVHNVLHAKKRHKLLVASEGLRERICPEHARLLEVFCHTDQQFICHPCITDKHRAHDVDSVTRVVAKTQVNLKNIEKEVSDRIKTREKEIEELSLAAESFQKSADDAVRDHGRIFAELIHAMEERQGKVTELILAQQEDALQKAKDVLKELQEKISDLKTIDAKLQYVEGLFQTGDELRFLQGALSVPALPYSSSSVLFVHPYCSFQFASKAVSKLIEQLKQICQVRFTTISDRIKQAGILTSPVPKRRESLAKSKLTLNLNTAHPSFHFSKDNREVTAMPSHQFYSDHSERFDSRAQILCNEALQGGPHYWEVEYGGNFWVCIAVSYNKIIRKGKMGPLFGRNNCSWGLRCYSSTYNFWHNNKKIPLEYNRQSSIIGVYLDHGAGKLAFYNVLDNMSLIYKVQTMFTEPLYAGFGLAGKGTHIRLCD